MTRTVAAALAIVWLAAPARAATLFDPALRFRVIGTEHFEIYFHQGEARAAGRLAVIAEETWRALQRPLGVQPPPHTRVVLADQTEFANGFATPVPYDTVVIYTVWPGGAEFDFDDWLRLAFTHEFTHIVHLDRSEGWARLARRIFGRTSWAFPNLFLPSWQVEGLATYEESAITGEGRMHAGDFRAIVTEAARVRRLEPLDRVNGGLTDWPAGAAPYAYGVRFHQYLVDRFGAESLAALAEATARRFPYTSTRAFLYVYGEPLGDLWREYEASLAATAAVTSDPPIAPGVKRLTDHGYLTVGPRFDRFTCAGCAPAILYAVSTPDGFPSLNRVAADGSSRTEVTTRYLGTTTAPARDAIYFDQVELRRNVALYDDLYVMKRDDGHVRRLTSEARLRDPDVSPDGTTIVATQAGAGRRAVVTMRVETEQSAATPVEGATRAAKATSTAIRTLVGEPDVYYDAPRWSADGRSIAVARHRLGAMPDIVVVDASGGSVRVVASDPHTRFAMPAWRPDGGALVVAAAPGDDTFNLWEVAVDGSSRRQLTHSTGGALWPDVSSDGETIAFAGYTADGYDVFTMPYPRPVGALTSDVSVRLEPTVSEGRPAVTAQPAIADDPGGAVRANDYNPLPTLAPTSWFPVIVSSADQVRVGAAIGGVDVLGYHAYAADVTWLVSSTVGDAVPERASPDWTVSYAYDRWRATLFAAAGIATSFSAGPPTAAGAPAAATRRERTQQAGVLLPFRHTRIAHAALASVVRSTREDTTAIAVTTRDRTALRAAWQTATAHTYGFSVSPEGGMDVGGAVEVVRRDLGSSGDATTTSVDARVYLPGAALHHVVAVRVSGGSSSGDAGVGRTFLLGGSTPDVGTISFDSRSSSLLRGFADATFAGRRVVLANAEYRWPLARPQRGVGTWPVFLHTVHAAGFVDAGETWSTAFSADSLKISVGTELSADIVAGYFARLTISGGAAWGHDLAHTVADRVTGYVRIGKAF